MATAYQIGGRYPSTSTLHAKRRCRKESVATFYVGADGAEEGTAALTPTTTTPCWAAAKAWKAESDRPKNARPVAGGSLTVLPISTVGNHPPGRKSCVGGGGGRGDIGGLGGGGGKGVFPPPPPPPSASQHGDRDTLLANLCQGCPTGRDDS